MKIDRIDEIIVTRQLTLLGAKKPVIIEVGCPKKCPGEEDYFCAYRLTGLGDERVRYAIGIDQVQSLLLTLKRIGADLYSSLEYRTGCLYWLEESERDLGFPTPDGFEVPPVSTQLQ